MGIWYKKKWTYEEKVKMLKTEGWEAFLPPTQSKHRKRWVMTGGDHHFFIIIFAKKRVRTRGVVLSQRKKS